ncbi:MAG: class E sortase [Actinomycetota bacterium]
MLRSAWARLRGAREFLRERPVPRRITKVLSAFMLLGGLALVLFPLFTNLFANHLQGKLRVELESTGLRRAYVLRKVPVGHALTRLVIPKLGVDTVVVQGTTLSALRAGSGHYVRSALPCEDGNAAIAGHRTTYSQPFAELDELRPGDRIDLQTPIGRCVYQVVRRPWAIGPYDWGAVMPHTSGALLTLTTCNPPGWATQRLVVRARLVQRGVAADFD